MRQRHGTAVRDRPRAEGEVDREGDGRDDAGEQLVAQRDPVSLVMFGFIAASLFWVVAAPWWSYPWEYLSFTAQFAGVGPELPSWMYVAYMVILGTVVPFALAMASMRHIVSTGSLSRARR